MKTYTKYIVTTATDGTKTITEFEPGQTTPVRVTIKQPGNDELVIDYHPDRFIQQEQGDL